VLYYLLYINTGGAVAQRVERWTCDLSVWGPIYKTILGKILSLS